ncbi:phiSA1p31-related protein [Kitasatospora sp. NPDC127111]|uniref:phiSA1p31-related protein n=1 Tax=Kitasatospora sp. NPDC127111 TaxID=3345363 RepID=UPI003645224D
MTEQMFKVGDKVNHCSYGAGVVRFGPFAPVATDEACRYLVELESHHGRHGMFDRDSLTARPAFEIGAAVVVDGERCTVAAGPFRDRYESSRPWYVVENPDGSHETSAVRYMTPAPADEPVKIGDRVRVVEAAYAEELIGHVGRVTAIDGSWTPRGGELHPFTVEFPDGGRISARRVERVDEAPETYIYRYTTYDLTASYRDRDGDVWHFTGLADAAGCPKVSLTRGTGRPLSEIIDNFGPLTRVIG